MNPVITAPTRRAVYAPNGMVATSQPLVAAAGLHILRTGGSAADAAVAMAAALTVVEPTGNGIGSDMMAIVASERGIDGMIGAGCAPARLDSQTLMRRSHPRGWSAVTVPAAPRAWAALAEQYGRLPFTRLLEPAIQYAHEGFPLSPVVAAQWQRAEEIARGLAGAEFAGFVPTFLPGGFAPKAGAHFTNPDLAMTLERIANSHADDLYTGALAQRIIAFSVETSGSLRAEDLAAHAVEWVEPASVVFRGRRIWELPPPTQGAVALVALGLLDTLGAAPDPVEAEHRAIEAVKHAFAQSLPVIADGPEARAWLHSMLASSTLAEESHAIGTTATPGPADARLGGGTVYLAAVDCDGMMASVIQSNYMGFGSYVVVPGTGISLANRGACFSHEPGHPNSPHARHRPYNTIIPGLLGDEEGRPLGPFGVMGGFMQPQGHVQLMLRLCDEQLDPQAALDAPRWRFLSGRKVVSEPEFSQPLRDALARRGHDISVEKDRTVFGRGQIILRHGAGYVAGSDNRSDGCALGW